MTEIERAREARAAQGVRVANAGRGKKRDREMESYLQYDRVVRRLEAEGESDEREQ